MVARRICVCAAFFLALATAAPGIGAIRSEKHLPPADSEGADFGARVAIDGDWAVVGAPGAAANTGAAFVFAYVDDAWLQSAELTAPDGAVGDRFGASVSMHAGWLAVGAPEDDAPSRNSGSVYLFQHSADGWQFHSQIIATDAQTTDLFGASVAIDAGRLLVGAPNEDAAGSNAGAAYAFQFDESAGAWIEQQKLAPGGPGDLFGTSLSLRAGASAIGAPGDDDRGSNAGAVYVYRASEVEWMLDAVLRGSDSASGDEFGSAVAMGEERIVVGAPRDNIDAHLDAGAAFIFLRGDEWIEEAKLVSADASASDFLGRAVAIEGDIAIVGSSAEDAAATNAGAVYSFRRADGQWSADPRITAPDAAAFDAFGSAIALDGDRWFVGAPGVDDRGADAGAAYSMSFAPDNLPPTCDAGPGYEDECSGDSVTRIALDGSASLDPDEDMLTFLWSTDCPSAEFDDPESPRPVLSLRAVACSVDCRVTLTVSDGVNPPVSCEAPVRVLDRSAPELACPPEAKVFDGQDLSPDALGSATVIDCDPAVRLDYRDETVDPACASDIVAGSVRRTWSAVDACGNSSSCEQLIHRLRTALSLDIKPGDCENRHNAGSRGYLPVLLLGASDFDLSQVDLASLRISRADCTGQPLAPNSGPPGPRPRIADAGSPMSVEPCACHSSRRDGFADVEMHFNSEALASALLLAGAEGSVTVAITGIVRTAESPEGVSFVAIDCLNLVPNGGGSGGGGRGGGQGGRGGSRGDSAPPNPPVVDPCATGMLPGAMLTACLLLASKARRRGQAL